MSQFEILLLPVTRRQLSVINESLYHEQLRMSINAEEFDELQVIRYKARAQAHHGDPVRGEPCGACGGKGFSLKMSGVVRCVACKGGCIIEAETPAPDTP